ncbi:unnamed protein product [Oppiella nova]|uniref:C2H2-type domain-containing protein n=1 Tax=Oppiella nova TaxID=334625 RepID=A0A7R9QNZ8_9ACAR|nr:unnamed protein product [Oppiella nova]CAG2170272.1 unnamed protein product [Oppiella nova]
MSTNYETCCGHCKQFATTGHRHKLAVHLNETKCICNEENCGKHFKSKVNLNQHELKHTRDPPFVCDFGDCKRMPGLLCALNIISPNHLTPAYFTPAVSF